LGCDIHWTIERLHQDGVWEGVFSKHYFSDQAEAGGFAPWGSNGAANREAYWQLPQYRIGAQNYELFAALSDVRNDDYNFTEFALTPGVPDDASKQYLQDVESMGMDGHSHGWAFGSLVLSWKTKRRQPLAGWASRITEVLRKNHCNTIMSDRTTTSHDGYCFEEFAGTETGHGALARVTRSEGLLPWKENPDAWRILVFYDN